jgi:drug/metabolite transporter (DMT)-like permease
MLVNFHSGLSEFHFVWNGDGFVVLAAFILSAATLYGKRISQTVDPMVMTGWQLAIGGAMLVAGGYARAVRWCCIASTRWRCWDI